MRVDWRSGNVRSSVATFSKSSSSAQGCDVSGYATGFRVPDLRQLSGNPPWLQPQEAEAYESASHVLLNPPYTLVTSTVRLRVAYRKSELRGTVHGAVVKNCEGGTRIGAVLPECSSKRQWLREVAHDA